MLEGLRLLQYSRSGIAESPAVFVLCLPGQVLTGRANSSRWFLFFSSLHHSLLSGHSASQTPKLPGFPQSLDFTPNLPLKHPKNDHLFRLEGTITPLMINGT